MTYEEKRLHWELQSPLTCKSGKELTVFSDRP